MSSAGPFYFAVEVVENERRYPLVGWGGGRLLPTDRWHFSSHDGHLERTREAVSLELPTDQKCSWVTPWEVYVGTDETDHFVGSHEGDALASCKFNRFDNDGFEYSIDFPRSYCRTFQTLTHWVRRRFWRRVFRVDADASYVVHFDPKFKAVLRNGFANFNSREKVAQEYSLLRGPPPAPFIDK